MGINRVQKIETNSVGILNLPKVIFLYSEQEKHKFSSSKAVLLISVGQAAHEGEKLEATIQVINQKFKSCDICIADTLQRHTLDFTENDASGADFYLTSKRYGREWLERNHSILEKMTIPHKCTRWDIFLWNENISEYMQEIRNAYNECQKFRDAFDQTAHEFIDRVKKRGITFDESSAFMSCLNYLIEECAIYYLMWPVTLEHRYHYFVYPNKISKALEVCYKKFIVANNIDLCKWCQIDVKSRSKTV